MALVKNINYNKLFHLMKLNLSEWDCGQNWRAEVKGIAERAACTSDASLRADGAQSQSTYDHSIIKIKVACPRMEVCSAGCQYSETSSWPTVFHQRIFFLSIYLNHFIFLIINLSIKKLGFKKKC
jgi:hypothetical protein